MTQEQSDKYYIKVAQLCANNSYALKQIWIEVMEKYGKGNSWYDIPNNVIGVITDPISGKLATNENLHKRILYYIKGTEPKQ